MTQQFIVKFHEVMLNQWLRRCLDRAVLLAAALWCLSSPAGAEAARDCERFVNTPNGVVDLFDAPMPTFENGQALPSHGAFPLALKPADRVVYPHKSDHNHDAGYGAVIAIEYVAPGRYRIGLSRSAQIDAVQGNAQLGVLPVPEREGCSGISRSLDIVTTGGPMTLQISGAETSRINVVLVPVRNSSSNGAAAEPQ
jgi:hypothetical protein